MSNGPRGRYFASPLQIRRCLSSSFRHTYVCCGTSSLGSARISTCRGQRADSIVCLPEVQVASLRAVGIFDNIRTLLMVVYC